MCTVCTDGNRVGVALAGGAGSRGEPSQTWGSTAGEALERSALSAAKGSGEPPPSPTSASPVGSPGPSVGGGELFPTSEASAGSTTLIGALLEYVSIVMQGVSSPQATSQPPKPERERLPSSNSKSGPVAGAGTEGTVANPGNSGPLPPEISSTLTQQQQKQEQSSLSPVYSLLNPSAPQVVLYQNVRLCFLILNSIVEVSKEFT